MIEFSNSLFNDLGPIDKVLGAIALWVVGMFVVYYVYTYILPVLRSRARLLPFLRQMTHMLMEYAFMFFLVFLFIYGLNTVVGVPLPGNIAAELGLRDPSGAARSLLDALRNFRPDWPLFLTLLLTVLLLVWFVRMLGDIVSRRRSRS